MFGKQFNDFIRSPCNGATPFRRTAQLFQYDLPTNVDFGICDEERARELTLENNSGSSATKLRYGTIGQRIIR